MTDSDRQMFLEIKHTLKNIELILDFIGVMVVLGIVFFLTI